MSKSLLDNDKVCFICGTPFDLHKHHVYKGTGKRSHADEDGCWCYLCGKHHNLSNEGVHSNTPFNITLEKFTQHLWEETNGTREQFRQRYGKSYL